VSNGGLDAGRGCTWPLRRAKRAYYSSRRHTSEGSEWIADILQVVLKSMLNPFKMRNHL